METHGAYENVNAFFLTIGVKGVQLCQVTVPHPHNEIRAFDPDPWLRGGRGRGVTVSETEKEIKVKFVTSTAPVNGVTQGAHLSRGFPFTGGVQQEPAIRKLEADMCSLWTEGNFSFLKLQYF